MLYHSHIDLKCFRSVFFITELKLMLKMIDKNACDRLIWNSFRLATKTFIRKRKKCQTWTSRMYSSTVDTIFSFAQSKFCEHFVDEQPLAAWLYHFFFLWIVCHNFPEYHALNVSTSCNFIDLSTII